MNLFAVLALALMCAAPAFAWADQPPPPPDALKCLSVAPEASGTLICACEPYGAEVYLDGVLIGEAPLRKGGVPEGDHTLTLTKPGYETYNERITIKKGVTLTVGDELAEARGVLTILTEPPGVSVYVDGRRAGVSPIEIKKVSGGVHKVRLTRDYMEPYEKEVTLETGGRELLRATVRRRLLLIGSVEGGEDAEGLPPELEGLLIGPLKAADSIMAIPVGMKSLAQDIAERGLEPDSAGFLKMGKANLDLEDAAVLDGIMEESNAGLALAALLRHEGQRMTLKLTLYSISADMGDVKVISADDMAGLAAEFERYIKGLHWR